MKAAARISAFVPERCDPEILEQILVGRESLLEDAVARIADGLDGGSKHNLCYVGPSGIGKTMFLCLVAHRIRESKKLSSGLRLAALAQVEVSTTFLDLLLRVHRALSAAYPQEFEASQLHGIHDSSEDEALALLERQLLQSLAGRLLVLQIEDLEGCFKALGGKGQNQLRAFLQEHATTTILATTQRLFEGISSRDAPFFGFFQVEHLQALSLAEAYELVDRFAHVRHKEPLLQSLQGESGQASLASLHFLCGGLPRSILLTAATATSFADPLPLFAFCVDALTPFYRERVGELASQQRRILTLLARAEAPVPVKHLARELFMTHQTATALLKTLREKAWVMSSTRGRESLYELADPMMRYTLGLFEDREERLASTLDFLQAWFRPEPAPQISKELWGEQPPAQVLAALAASSSDPQRWRAACADLCDRASRHDALGSLGKALITSIDSLGLGPDLCDAWRDLWLTLGHPHPALWQALRLFSATISWHQTRNDHALLTLLSHERRLLSTISMT